jgi:tripartite-type tricarboxylate transporter receptor subunit TctC
VRKLKSEFSVVMQLFCILLLMFSMDANSATNSPMTIAVPFGAGSATDISARYLSQRITMRTGQPVIVENRAGGNGLIGVQYAKTLPGNGNSLMLTSNTTQAANPSLYHKLSYDPKADFIPITGIVIGGVLLVINPQLSVNSVQELIKLARSKPGKLTFGSGNSTSQAGGELFKKLAGIQMTHVPYKSIPAAISDLLGGQIDMLFTDPISVQAMVRSGKLRAIGVSSKQRIPGFEDIPTIAEQGVRNYELSGWIAAYAPKGTPPQEVARLNKLIKDILREKESIEFFDSRGWRIIANSSAELAAFQAAEAAKWKDLVQFSGMEVQ